MGLNTGCWKLGRTYTMSPVSGPTFLQPGGNATISYTVSRALNVAVKLVVTSIWLLVSDYDRTSWCYNTLQNWKFPDGASNFQLVAESLWVY